MFSNVFGWQHLLIIALVLLLLFGATRLPALSRSLGQSVKILRKDFKDMKKEDESNLDSTLDDTVAATPPSTAPAAHSTVKASEL